MAKRCLTLRAFGAQVVCECLLREWPPSEVPLERRKSRPSTQPMESRRIRCASGAYRCVCSSVFSKFLCEFAAKYYYYDDEMVDRDGVCAAEAFLKSLFFTNSTNFRAAALVRGRHFGFPSAGVFRVCAN